MIHVPLHAAWLPLALAVFTTHAAIAADDIRSERIRFQRGASSAVVEGSIKGYAIVDYVLGARQGQYINVGMATDNNASYFNVMEPGETEVAIFNGSTADNQYEGELARSGDYRVRVYMMRSAARRNEVANYRLEVSIGDAPGASAGSNEDALVPGTKYNATGSVACSMGMGQPTGDCPFGMTRQGGGGGTLTVTRRDGRTRAIFFEKGKPTGYDFSQADQAEFRTERQADLIIVHIGKERYEIPEALVFGD